MGWGIIGLCIISGIAYIDLGSKPSRPPTNQNIITRVIYHDTKVLFAYSETRVHPTVTANFSPHILASSQPQKPNCRKIGAETEDIVDRTGMFFGCQVRVDACTGKSDGESCRAGIDSGSVVVVSSREGEECGQ